MVVLAFLAVVCWANSYAIADNWRAQRALANNDVETAQELWSSVVVKSPHDLAALHGLANIAYIQERYQDCLQLIETVVEQAQEQQKVRALMDRAACYAKLNELEKAEQDLDAVLQSAPTNKKAAHNKRVIQLERMVREQQKSPQQQQKDKNQQNQQSPKTGDKQQQQSQSSQQQDSGSKDQQDSEQKSSEQGQQQPRDGSEQQQDSQGSQQPLPKPAASAEALREGREQGPGQKQQQNSNGQQQDGEQGQESEKKERGSRRRKTSEAANKKEQEKQLKAAQGTPVPDERLTGEQQQLLAQIAADEQEMQKYAIAHQATQVGSEEQGTRW